MKMSLDVMKECVNPGDIVALGSMTLQGSHFLKLVAYRHTHVEFVDGDGDTVIIANTAFTADIRFLMGPKVNEIFARGEPQSPADFIRQALGGAIDPPPGFKPN